MLVAERDLEVKYFFAVTLKAEVSRLDHAGMHRTDGHFVNLVTIDREIVGDARFDRRILQLRPQTSRPGR